MYIYVKALATASALHKIKQEVHNPDANKA